MTAHACEDIEKMKHLLITYENANLCSHYGNQCGVFSGSLEVIHLKVHLYILLVYSQIPLSPITDMPAQPRSLLLYLQ